MSGNIKLNTPSSGSVTLSAADTASNLTVTVPAATDTLVNLASTQTLTNKTLTSPTITGATLSGSISGGTFSNSNITAANGNTVEATSGPTSTQLAGMRNKIINGAMMIDQRNAGASVALSNTTAYTLDRFAIRMGSGSGHTAIRSSTTATGFAYSLLITVGTGGTPSSSTNSNYMYQGIEGTNCADLNWGTANAKSVTLSFWVRSSLTGTFGGVVRNDAGNRCYPFTYTISAANTFEYKTITIPGDTSGTWVIDSSGSGIQLMFDLGIGSTYLSTAGSWASGDYRGATGDTQLVATSGATFYITGVQLEKGSTATPFENRLYGAELALCQRYYSKSFNTDSAPGNNLGTPYTAITFSVINATNAYSQGLLFPVSMRAAPTITFYNPLAANAGTWHVYGPVSGSSEVTPSLPSGYISTNGIAPNLGGNYVLAYGAWTASAEL